MKLYLDNWAIAQNLFICGVNGTRKSSVIRGLIDQARAKGYRMIHLDKKCEYWAEYGRPEIDHLVNFADARSSEWRIDREANSQFEARSMMAIAVPMREGSIPFFVDKTRDMGSFLLGAKRMRAADIVQAVRHTDGKCSSLAALLYGSGYENCFPQDSPDMRNGMLGNLASLAEFLSFIPTGDDKPQLCLREWAQTGKGDIFFASTPADFEAQKAIQTLMLNMLILYTQTYGGKFWYNLDEVGVWGPIDELVKALSFARSSGNIFVPACQTVSQLDDNYNAAQKKTICSNPGYKLILRGEDPDEAVYLARLLAETAEVNRVRETVDGNPWKGFDRKQHSYMSERPMVYPVTPGEVQKAPDGHGWLKRLGDITPVRLAYRAGVENQPKFIPRVWPKWVAPEKPAPAPVPEVTLSLVNLGPKAKEEKKKYQSKYKDVKLPI